MVMMMIMATLVTMVMAMTTINTEQMDGPQATALCTGQ